MTAVQLMFAGCASTCSVQGAIFAAVAQRIDATRMRLLSLTVDPLGDSPAALRAWHAKFGAPSHWSVAAPRVEDVGPLMTFLRGRTSEAATHPAHVFLFDREAQLAFRTVEMPSPAHVADLLTQLASA